MKGATALKKINARAKALKKKFPGAKRTTLMKKAGAEYRAGKLKPKRKAVKRKAVRRKKARIGRVYHVVVAGKKHRRKKRRVARTKTRRKVGTVRRRVRRTVRKAKRRVYRTVRRAAKRVYRKRRKVSGFGKNGKLLLIGALAIGAYLLFRRPSYASQPTTYIPTGNGTTDSKAQTIIAAATAAGLVATQIAKLIQQINAANATQTSLSTLQQHALTAPSLLGDDSSVQSILASSGQMMAGVRTPFQLN